ncbi:MAG: hypothetical protein N3E41_00195 [Thermofilaceae archaeon]|nr:hypothetical protein [Thermofilaceae archaeon]
MARVKPTRLGRILDYCDCYPGVASLVGGKLDPLTLSTVSCLNMLSSTLLPLSFWDNLFNML